MLVIDVSKNLDECVRPLRRLEHFYSFMMRFIVSILAILYLSTSMGAPIYLHYCMGQLADWGIWHADSSKCGKCGMQKNHKSMDDGCCQDEYKQIKNDNDQKLSEGFAQLNKAGIEIISLGFPVSSFTLPVILKRDSPKANAPPRSCHTSINIINCVFLI